MQLEILNSEDCKVNYLRELILEMKHEKSIDNSVFPNVLISSINLIDHEFIPVQNHNYSMNSAPQKAKDTGKINVSLGGEQIEEIKES